MTLAFAGLCRAHRVWDPRPERGPGAEANDMNHILFALLFVGGHGPAAPDCGAAAHRAEITDTLLSVTKTVPVEPTIGELPTKEGTQECVRVAFSLTPWGTIYRLRFVESSGNFPFEMSVRRAIEQYQFQGSILGTFRTKTLVFEGIDNKRPGSWNAACERYDCDGRH